MCKYEALIQIGIRVEFEDNGVDSLKDQAVEALPSEVEEAADIYDVLDVKPVGKKR